MRKRVKAKESVEGSECAIHGTDTAVVFTLLCIYAKLLTPKMSVTKKRKVDSECRAFQDEWTWKYFFIDFKDKPMCLFCNETVSVYKDFNISRHFTSKHNYSQYANMTDNEKKQKVENLRKKLLS